MNECKVGCFLTRGVESSHQKSMYKTEQVTNSSTGLDGNRVGLIMMAVANFSSNSAELPRLQWRRPYA